MRRFDLLLSTHPSEKEFPHAFSQSKVSQMKREVNEEEEEESIDKKVEDVPSENNDVKEVIPEKAEPKKYEDPLGEDYQTELKNKFGRKHLHATTWDKNHLDTNSKSV